jgi:hypothetical protein
MMHFTGKIGKIKIDNVRYTEAIREELKHKLRRAVADWLRAVIEYVPVSTGMARASLIPLGQVVGVNVFTATTIGNNAIRKESPTRNKALGEATGMSGGFFGGNQYQLTFVYQILIDHYLENETSAHPGANEQVISPWESMEAGREAFAAFMEHRITTGLPRLKDYVHVEEVNLELM